MNPETVAWVPVVFGVVTLLVLWWLGPPAMAEVPPLPGPDCRDFKALRSYVLFQRSQLQHELGTRPDAARRRALEDALESIASTLKHHPLVDDLRREVQRCDKVIHPSAGPEKSPGAREEA